MGRIIGNKKSNIKTFTEEEVKILTNDLNEKITELTAENVKIKDEFDTKNEVIENLNEKITELTAENESLNSKINELSKNTKEKTKDKNE